MPTYKYKKENIKVKTSDVLSLRIEFPEPGRAGTHDVDLPGPNDKRDHNACTIELGKGSHLITERTVVISTVFNLDSDMEDVNVNYFLDVNDKLSEKAIVEHSNPVSEDDTPTVKIVLTFKAK